MKNYLMLNNKKIELSPEQVKQIEESFGFNRTELKNIPEGETFKVGELEFIVLEHREVFPGHSETLVILKELWKNAKFDDKTNDYKNSSIRKLLNTDFYELISKSVGAENIVNHAVDITADDGRTDYGSCDDNISLLDCDMYRKYVYILEKYNPKKWWWLVTPYSTKSNGYEVSVRCVLGSGAVNDSLCNDVNGVRPFCILKSSIFVSK